MLWVSQRHHPLLAGSVAPWKSLSDHTILTEKQMLRQGNGTLSGPVLRDTTWTFGPRIARDYLSDTPLLRAMGFLASQHGQLGAIPPPPFLSVSPVESMRSGGAIVSAAIPPHKRGISAILARYPMKTRQMGPMRYYLEKVLRDRGGGGISHWAAKTAHELFFLVTSPVRGQSPGRVANSQRFMFWGELPGCPIGKTRLTG